MIELKTSRCRNCRKEVVFARFRDLGLWEPDLTGDPVTWRHVGSGYAACMVSVGGRFAEPGMPEVVVLCGSTRFRDAFNEVNQRLTLEGKIVLSVGMFGSAPEPVVYLEEIL